MIISRNNINVPQCINEEFFNALVKNYLNNSDFEINEIFFDMGSNAGENYTSDIYRVKTTFTKDKKDVQTISLIIKSMSMEGVRECMKKIRVYEKEVFMYFEIIPQIEKLLGIERIGPRVYYAIEEPLRIIAMEDLKSLGYSLADREKGLDEAHSEVVLKKLGKFHAASMVLAKTYPEMMKEFYTGWISPEMVETPLFDAIALKHLVELIKVMEGWTGFETIRSKLQNMEANFKLLSLNIVEPRNGEIKVLNHGDTWVNNMLFNYDELHDPKDIMFVDYQISFYSSPGIDINYLLSTSVQLDVLKNKRDDLIKIYYETLRVTLKNLNYENIPTYENILHEIAAKEFYGFFSAVCIRPLISMDRSECNDNLVETMMEETIAAKKREIMFSSKRYQDAMKHLLIRFDKLGVFDEQTK